MSKKRVIISVIIILVLILFGTFLWYLLEFLGQEKALRNELNEISEMMQDVETVDLVALDKKFTSTVTMGDYQIVEKAIKQYFKDTVDYSIEIKELIDEEKIEKILTAENYKNDGPDFVETTKYINEAKAKIEEAKKFFTEILTDEKIMSYIDGKTDDEYYIELYKELALGDEAETMQEDEESINLALDELIEILNKEENVINMLKENKGNWEMQGDNIMFETDELIDEYNSLISELQ